MNSFNNKRPAYMYAKGFKLDKFLGNLQGYKIATGQVSKDEFKDVSKKYGSDEGAVFGALITNASGNFLNEGIKREKQAKKRRRKIRKPNMDKIEDATPESNSSSEPLPLGEPLSIPAALLAYEGCSTSNDDDSKMYKSGSSSSSSSCSGSDDGVGDVDFFGLSSKQEKSRLENSTNKTSGESSNEETSVRLVSQTNQDRLRCHQKIKAERQPIVWDSTQLKFNNPISTLSSYKCWKCSRVGHLPHDCTVQISNSLQGSSINTGQGGEGVEDYRKQKNSKGSYYSKSLKEYFKRCQKLRESTDVKCSDCGGRSNLAYCFECGLTLCDGRGHLIDHLLEYPTHTKLYSYKLQRQVKCCKSICEVVDARELLMCSSCLDRAFTSHYSMINATWSRTGLRLIPNALACDQHFQWHRMNCANPTGEPLVTREKLESSQARGEGLLSEFYF